MDYYLQKQMGILEYSIITYLPINIKRWSIVFFIFFSSPVYLLLTNKA